MLKCRLPPNEVFDPANKGCYYRADGSLDCDDKRCISTTSTTQDILNDKNTMFKRNDVVAPPQKTVEKFVASPNEYVGDWAPWTSSVEKQRERPATIKEAFSQPAYINADAKQNAWQERSQAGRPYAATEWQTRGGEGHYSEMFTGLLDVKEKFTGSGSSCKYTK